MATNLAIDPLLLDKAFETGGEKTKKATVNRALREFIARREQERLLDLFGETRLGRELRLQTRTEPGVTRRMTFDS